MDASQETAWQVGPEVEFFARNLDDCLAARGNTPERRSRVFRLVNTYHTYSNDKLSALKKTSRSKAQPRDHSRDDEMELDEPTDLPGPRGDTTGLARWELETQTWDLLRRVLPLRYPQDDAPNRTEGTSLPQSRREYWDEFLRSDPAAFERKAVVEWLQHTAESGPDINEITRELQENSERGDIVAYGWIHTRSAVKKTKMVHAWPTVLASDSRAVADVHVGSTGTALVTQLDPDSSTRQQRKLEPQDEYFEKAIWLGCFELLRRGKSTTEISEWCRERTEAWRAVSMTALPMSQDDDVDCDSPFDPAAVVLWRRLCYALARQGGTDDYERAVYGLVSGDIPSVEKVSRSWDDLLFAHYNALLRTQFDSFLLKRCQPDGAASICQNFPVFNAVQFHGDTHSLSQPLISNLGPNSANLAGKSSPLKALQASIVTGTLDSFLFQQGISLAKQATTKGETSNIIHDFGLSDKTCSGSASELFLLNDQDVLRVAAHVQIIVLALDKLTPRSPQAFFGSDSRRYVQQNIVAAYATAMRVAYLDHLVPLYCSKLEGSRMYEALSRNMIHLDGRQDREGQLVLMHKLGLDPAKFVKLQANLLLQDAAERQALDDYSASTRFRVLEPGPPGLKYGRGLVLDYIGEDVDNIEPLDESLIRSMEWLFLADDAWEETVAMGANLHKYFLGHLKLAASRSLAERVPCYTVLAHKLAVPASDGSDPSWFLEVEGRLMDEDVDDDSDAEETPVKPHIIRSAREFWELEALIRVLDTIETISSLIQISREDPSTNREFWTKVASEVELMKNFMKPLLNKWMKSRPGGEELRKAYLPETIMGYVSILHFAGMSYLRDNLLECMDLAAQIADKGSDVADLLVSCGRMKELLEAFASCSKALAVCNGEKKGTGGASKRLRENGWSRDLWSVRP